MEMPKSLSNIRPEQRDFAWPVELSADVTILDSLLDISGLRLNRPVMGKVARYRSDLDHERPSNIWFLVGLFRPSK